MILFTEAFGDNNLSMAAATADLKYTSSSNLIIFELKFRLMGTHHAHGVRY